MNSSIPMLSIERLHQLTPAFDLLQYADALSHRCFAVREANHDILIVAENPTQAGLTGWIDVRLQAPFRLAGAQPGDVLSILAKHKDSLKALDSATTNENTDDAKDGRTEILTLASIQEDGSPIIRLTNSTFYDAYQAGASDIHFESTPAGLKIRYRLDGVLNAIKTLPGIETAEQVLSRIKVLAELDIAERRIPQDGRIKLSINERDVDLRVSIMPSVHGEDAVLRILDKHSLTDQVSRLSLDYLGFDPETIHQIRRLAREPHGMLLVTGPTGSGKTTTLYAVITEINDGRDKIITIEDPVEYQLPDVLQIPVNEKKGLTFARGLRSILRHDPDKILVGEIRDEETAEIAIQSALTGHLVLTTVHANNVFDVISRFLHMGVAPHAFSSAINGILAQRLIRLNCPKCLIEDRPEAKLIVESGLAVDDCADFTFRRGQGCGHCHGTGFKGRRAVAEILRITPKLRDLIAQGATGQAIAEIARSGGMLVIRDAAMTLVRNGQTTLDEINRVTFVD